MTSGCNTASGASDTTTHEHGHERECDVQCDDVNTAMHDHGHKCDVDVNVCNIDTTCGESIETEVNLYESFETTVNLYESIETHTKWKKLSQRLMTINTRHNDTSRHI